MFSVLMNKLLDSSTSAIKPIAIEIAAKAITRFFILSNEPTTEAMELCPVD